MFEKLLELMKIKWPALYEKLKKKENVSAEDVIDVFENLPSNYEIRDKRSFVTRDIEAGRAMLREAKSKDGSKWRISILKAGISDNRFYWPQELLPKIARLCEGARALVRPDEEHLKDKQKSVKNIVGWYSNASVEGNEVVADFHIMESAGWLKSMLVEAWEQGKPDLVGFSIVTEGLVKPNRINGRAVREVKDVIKVSSIDPVVEASAGGRIINIAAAKNSEEEDMLKERLLKVIEAKWPKVFEDKLKGRDDVTEDEVIMIFESLDSAVKAPAGDGGNGNGAGDAKASAGDGDKKDNLVDFKKEMEERFKISECKSLLRETLAESKLPDISKGRISKIFEGKAFEENELNDVIKDEKEYLGKISQSGRVSGLGQGATKIIESKDKIQAAMDRLAGLEVPDEMKDVPRLTGIREAYITMTGDSEINGEFQKQRITEAFDSTTFTYALGNTMHRRLIKDYKEKDYGVEKISSEISASDFKTRESVRIGYFGDIPDVDPETADYAEITEYGEEKSSYSVGQKGVVATVTRKHIINDDLGVVTKIPGRFGRSAKRTLARFVWNFFINNSNTFDGKAIFHADHNNLGSSALAVATVKAGLDAIAAQTEPSSLEKLGLKGKLLVVPDSGTVNSDAFKINVSDREPGSANWDANILFHKFGANNEDILELSLLTDANDWFLFADPNDVDIFEIAFLNGQKEPELFLADNPVVGQMFLADKIQYKIRHEYGGCAPDYRGTYKAVVA